MDDKKKALPATPSPVPSPSADAPSPGNTPPLQDMDDNEQIDMDLDEEQDSSKHNGKCKMKSKIAPNIMISVKDQYGLGPVALSKTGKREPSSSVVECLTRDQEVAGASLESLCCVLEQDISILCLVLIQPIST